MKICGGGTEGRAMARDEPRLSVLAHRTLIFPSCQTSTPGRLHVRAISCAAPSDLRGHQRWQANTGQTSTETHRGRLGRVAIWTGSSAAHEPSSQAPSLGQNLSTRGPLGVLQLKSDRFCHLWWPLRPERAAQGTAKPWSGTQALAYIWSVGSLRSSNHLNVLVILKF